MDVLRSVDQLMRPPGMGYRRAHLRYEVLGTMAATVVSTEPLRVVDIGASGALVDAELPLPLNAEYRMQLVIATHVMEATVKVRRIAEHRRQGHPLRYRIGLEFLDLPVEGQDVIGRLVAAARADGTPEIGV